MHRQLRTLAGLALAALLIAAPGLALAHGEGPQQTVDGYTVTLMPPEKGFFTGRNPVAVSLWDWQGNTPEATLSIQLLAFAPAAGGHGDSHGEADTHAEADSHAEAPTGPQTELAAPTVIPTEPAAPTKRVVPTAVPTEPAVPTAAPTEPAVPTAEHADDGHGHPAASATAAPTGEHADDGHGHPAAGATAAPANEPMAAPVTDPKAIPTNEPTVASTREPVASPTAEHADDGHGHPAASVTAASAGEPSANPTAEQADDGHGHDAAGATEGQGLALPPVGLAASEELGEYRGELTFDEVGTYTLSVIFTVDGEERSAIFDVAVAQYRPRGLVLGGFALVNGLAIGAAGWLKWCGPRKPAAKPARPAAATTTTPEE